MPKWTPFKKQPREHTNRGETWRSSRTNDDLVYVEIEKRLNEPGWDVEFSEHCGYGPFKSLAWAKRFAVAHRDLKAWWF
ncbi:MAG: hypothetical protein KGJ23_08020 [Euryarchaeota archaeon]|nr:hypothetical protein [Euryarchaeota archaeon]MDE1836547.1 hypothetical protein [Euryarchaeota archaeon]MDE1879258.1 hypothetical protein [Euryarchaeota archaeon]MDE2044517.1 hypothetical protein [Thermoplasmata archaeon]